VKRPKAVYEPFVSRIWLRRERIPESLPHPFGLPILREFDVLPIQSPVTFLVGDNGSGKSTFLQGIAEAYGFNPEGGSRNFNFNTTNQLSPLADAFTLVKNATYPRDGFYLRAESFFNVATVVDELAKEDPPFIHVYGGRSLHEQSHGESFLSLFIHRFKGPGFYVLDEPEAALSPAGLFKLIARLHQLVQSGSQFLIATHSPILMAYPRSELYLLTDNRLVLTPYVETEHFQLTKSFLNNPERVLGELMKD